LITRGLPLDRELLKVDYFISVHNFFDESASLLVVHTPDLLDALVVGLLESFKTLLQLDELVRKEFVFLGIQSVEVLCLGLLILELS